ncbi:MAG: hypothetical protein SGJ27_17455 [Candidatus Melainabacteria bacterium]|nr:hypothetical protein [Candidatus Melainabacteria bacterium]
MSSIGNLDKSDCSPSTQSIENANEETNKFVAQKLTLKTFFGSTFVILVLLLAFAAVSINLVPGKFLDAADGVPSQFRVAVSKISKFLDSKEEPDILLLGSSLWLLPSARCDDQMLGKPICYEDWYLSGFVNSYDKSLYFERRLKESGVNASVKNLAITSSLMSDNSDMFKTIMETGKRPKVIVCGLAPRDFIDATVKPGFTPTQLLLTEFKINQISNSPIDFSIDGLNYEKTKVVHHFEKIVARIRSISTDLIGDATNHSATEGVRTAAIKRPNVFKDLKTYKHIYELKSKEMLVRQADYLRDLLSCAKTHDVAVVLINMPLTKENISMLDRDLYNDYVGTIRDAAREQNALFLDVGSESKYDSLEDFEDSCHLSAQGGKKLFKTVVTAIAAEPALVAKLSTKH